MIISIASLIFTLHSPDMIGTQSCIGFSVIILVIIIFIRPLIWRFVIKLYYEPDSKVEDISDIKARISLPKFK
jgi:hypothetical protein